MIHPSAPFPAGTSHTKALWALLLTATLLRLYIVMMDINTLLIQGLIQDDAFYYYEIARHLLNTGVPSFDGINPTNGFHPLWQAICLPVFYIWQGDTPLRVMLGIASLLDVASIYLTYLILNRISNNPWVALCGAAILALHGTLIRTWFNGLETALHIFTLLFFLQHYLQMVKKPIITKKDHLVLGTLSAVAFLARTDSAVIIAVMFAFLYLPMLVRKEVAGGLLAASVIILIITPWLLWNYLRFGNIVQISGQVSGNVWLTGGMEMIDQPIYMDFLQAILVSIPPVGNVFKKMFVPVVATDIIGYVFLFSLLLLLYLSCKSSLAFRQQFRMLQPFFIGITLLFLYHCSIRQFVRGWYNAPVLLMIVMILALLLGYLLEKIIWKRLPPLLFVFLILCLLVFYSPYSYLRKSFSSLHPGISAAQWLNQHSPADSYIGAANAGIVGYYTERPIINLDGVVNEAAFHARIQNQIHRYVYESEIDYIADHTGSVAHLCADNAYYRCEEMDRWDNATVVARIIPLTK